MTHQNHQTNGASLEDCHTNFFALTDLCGIKWRKFLLGERPNASGDPLDDPVLRSYARCLQCDILCVWRRVAAPKQDPDPNGPNPFDIVTTHTHPPLSLTAAKELWIFWYGEEPNLNGLVDAELLKTSDAEAKGAWESGLSYECRSLLFKALHNLIERCLLSKDIVRLGKWFVQPCSPNERLFGKSSHHLSFSFAFFVHGESTVCASMDLREHPAVRPLSPEYLAEAAVASQINNDALQKPVILAPFGMIATLTGNSYKAIDSVTEKLLGDWSSFYPLCNKDNSDLPPIVEVISGGVKMRYPSKYVLVTELDDNEISSDELTNQPAAAASASLSSELATGAQSATATTSTTTTVTPTTQQSTGTNTTVSNSTGTLNECKKTTTAQTVFDSGLMATCNNFGNTISVHLPPTAATVLPERVWQDCIGNPLVNCGSPNHLTNKNNNSNSNDKLNSSSNIDNTSSNTANNQNEKSSNNGNSNSSNSNTSSANANNNSGNSNSSNNSSNSETCNQILGESSNPASNNSNSNNTSNNSNNSNSSSSNNSNMSGNNNSNVNNNNDCGIKSTWDLVDPNQKSTCICSKSVEPITSQPSGSSGFRNPLSIGDPMPIPSVGSPGSAGPSPHPNSTLSQPTSVPPSDQLPVVSPRPPTSVPNMQPPTPLEHLDKNTPAPTPTDQHDNKSVTASPYVQSTPSVERPPSTEPITCPSTANSGNMIGCAVKKIESLPNNNAMGNSNNSGNSAVNVSNISNPGNDQRSASNVISSGSCSAANMNAIISLLKRPLLTMKDYENSADEDSTMHHYLYDYSTWDAWMDHPVKRFKPNEDVKPIIKKLRCHNLYEGQIHSQPPATSPTFSFGGLAQISENYIKNDLMVTDSLKPSMNMDGGNFCNVGSAGDMLQTHDIKKEPADDVKDKSLTDNLYTNEGLQVSYKDLDQIFDNSDENSNDDTLQLQVHTPPGSNKSNCGGLDDIKRSINSNNPNTSILRPEELSKMFPTPPSHEHHPNSSPCSGGIMDIPMTDLIEGSKHKQEIYPDLGSPADEPIEDWSYVFMPPSMCKSVGSSKYAPLTNLPSQSLPPLIIPPNCIYKPSWLQQTQRQQDQVQNSSQPQSQPQQINNTNQSNHQIAMNMLERERQQQQQQVLSGQLSRPPSATSMLGFGGVGAIQSQQQSQPQSQQHLPLRAGMSPISPAAASNVAGGGIFAASSPMGHQHVNPYRRTPIPPPPPYELAVSSPATSTSSYLNRQYNSQEPPTPSSATVRAPEANALLINVLLYDTALNIFRDHNFDSCTLCVCNADVQKCVGNIRGSDSGVYVALPGTSFNPAISSNGNNTSCMGSANGILSTNNPINGAVLNSNSNMRNLSAFGGIDSPACSASGASNAGGGLNGGNQHQNGYIDEDPITCRCGFSAVVNRRLAHRSGLFYEDEMEITGMAEDPAVHKKKSLFSILISMQRSSINSSLSLSGGNDDNSMPSDMCDISQMCMDLLRDHCTIVQSSCSSVHRAVSRYRRRTTERKFNTLLNVLEFADANDVVCLAIEQGRIAFDIITAMNNTNRLEMEPYKPQKSNISVHRWPYVLANGTRSNQDIVRIMKSMQPLLQHAFHSKCVTRLWEPTYIVKGPLTWRQFHMLAGRGTGQCEPQPIPSVIVGHEKDWLSVAPYAIHYWDKLLLEPYSYPRDVVYLVIAPDNDFIINNTKIFFKELSTTYEMCKLGRHTPIKGWDGILRVGSRSKPDSVPFEEWFQFLGESKLAEQIRMYANAFQNLLIPYLSRIPNDKSLLDPPEGTSSGSINSNVPSRDRPLSSPMPPPSTPDPSQPGSEKAPSTPKCEAEQENQRESLNISATSNSPATDPLNSNDDDINPPVIVIYTVDPFTCGTDTPELRRLACLALLRCYSNILATIPESVRNNINFQTISLESVLELGRNRSRLRFSDEMRCLALSVFSQCRRFLSHTSNGKSLTGFGTAANLELFLKNKDEKNRAPYKMYTPPYILAPQHEKSEKTDTFRLKSVEQQYSVMYCNYCLSEDQSVLLAAATDDRGELLETIAINIDVPNRARRRRASARRLGLQKLMDFILGIISQTVQPWRLVIGRVGRIGHGELKSWSWLLSKQNLQKASKQLKEICKQCSLMYPHSVPSILSACLVTLEPDSNLRVMPDQFTPDERFSQISMQNPLSTPQDVTCTHILVFPTSAVSQSFQKAFNEQHINSESDDMIFDFDDSEDIGEVNSLGEIFDWDHMQQSSPGKNSNHGSPGCLEDNRIRQSPGPGGINSLRNMHDAPDIEEVGTVLQQPLALGYLVSTAPTGRMPSWFWSSCPHLENVCPVFLKTALHLHVQGIQQTSDDPLAQSHTSANDHPLDSTLTADVLRYVLEGYNVLSWLAMDSNTRDRLSCLPIHVQVLMQLYHMTAAMT